MITVDKEPRAKPGAVLHTVLSNRVRVCVCVYIRLLFSWPLGKILTGPVHYRVTLDPKCICRALLLKNSGKWQREDLLDLVFFCMCFLMSWTSFHKHDRANWIYVTMHEEFFFSWNIFHTFCNALASMRFLAWIVTYIQLAVSCLWNEAQDIRRHKQKSTKSSKSSLCHFPELLRTMILDIH